MSKIVIKLTHLVGVYLESWQLILIFSENMVDVVYYISVLLSEFLR